MSKIEKAKEMALNSAILFNEIAKGKSLKNYSDEELIASINLQVDIVMEENLEFFNNVEKNLIEELDAVIDSSFYTVGYLEHLVLEFNSRDIKEADGLLIRRLQHARCLGNHIEISNNFNEDVILEATKRIIENNEEKFTKDSEEFALWTGNYIRKTVEINNEYYYFFVDRNGKVRKRDNFPSVDLSDLVS